MAKLSTVSSLSLVLAPAVGGLIYSRYGLALVIYIDALTFLAAIILLRIKVFSCRENSTSTGDGSSRRQKAAFAPLRLPEALRSTKFSSIAIVWATFSVVGALINSIEAPYFIDARHFDPSMFGFAMSMYGLGGIAAFGYAHVLVKSSVQYRTMAAVFLIAILVWISFPGWISMIGFCLMGFGYGRFNGSVRSVLETHAVRHACDTKLLWTWAQEVSLASNVVISLGMILYFSAQSSIVWPSIVTIAVAIVMVLMCLRYPR